jgi:hypothetical protein
MIPCKECLIFSQCKYRVHNKQKTMGVIELAESENCPQLSRYLVFSSNSRDTVNRVRELFGLPTIDYKSLDSRYSTLITNTIPDFTSIIPIAKRALEEKNNERSL